MIMLWNKEAIKEGAQGEQTISKILLVRGVKMKILALATVAVFLCCLEVALSYPKFVPKPRYPEAELQEKAPFEMDGYRNEYIAEVEQSTFKYCNNSISTFQTILQC